MVAQMAGRLVLMTVDEKVDLTVAMKVASKVAYLVDN